MAISASSSRSNKTVVPDCWRAVGGEKSSVSERNAVPASTPVRLSANMGNQHAECCEIPSRTDSMLLTVADGVSATRTALTVADPATLTIAPARPACRVSRYLRAKLSGMGCCQPAIARYGV